MTAEQLIKTNRIVIVSGEGEQGSVEDYEGARTLSAIKRALRKERRGGDRWARAQVFSHHNGADVFLDIESGAYCSL